MHGDDECATDGVPFSFVMQGDTLQHCLARQRCALHCRAVARYGAMAAGSQAMRRATQSTVRLISQGRIHCHVMLQTKGHVCGCHAPQRTQQQHCDPACYPDAAWTNLLIRSTSK
jgi:hypothetical protein